MKLTLFCKSLFLKPILYNLSYTFTKQYQTSALHDTSNERKVLYQLTKLIKFTVFYCKRLLKNTYQCSLTSQIPWLLWARVWFLLCMKCTFFKKKSQTSNFRNVRHPKVWFYEVTTLKMNKRLLLPKILRHY